MMYRRRETTHALDQALRGLATDVTTTFVDQLRPVRESPPEATRSVAHLMRIKGYRDATAFGCVVDGHEIFYYFWLPEGVLEVKTWQDEKQRWTRMVSDFITRQEDIADMVGTWNPTTDELPVIRPELGEPRMDGQRRATEDRERARPPIVTDPFGAREQ